MTAPTNLATERSSRRSYQAADVIQLAHITYRQLDYWTRSELVHASGHASTGHGDARWYRDTDVVRICVIAALLRAGVSYAAIKERVDDLLDDGSVFINDGVVTINVDLQELRDRVDRHKRRSPW